VELTIERLLRRSTSDTLSKLIPALLTTAQRYSNKRSAPSLGSVWKPPTMAVAAAAAATAGEVAAAGSNGGSNAALVNTRLIKLMGSLKAWWPGSATAEQCQQVCCVGGRGVMGGERVAGVGSVALAWYNMLVIRPAGRLWDGAAVPAGPLRLRAASGS
jgi:hypothetical protein